MVSVLAIRPNVRNGFLRAIKNLQYAFLQRGSEAGGPM
jgi:hypothetical protein